MHECARVPRGIAGAIALLLASAACAYGQTLSPTPPPVGILTGVVRAVTGEPLGDVDVSLLGEAATTRTDSAGRFTLRDIPIGNHTALFRRI